MVKREKIGQEVQIPNENTIMKQDSGSQYHHPQRNFQYMFFFLICL